MMKTSMKTKMMKKMRTMSESNTQTPFFHWGECKSKDENNPDVLDLLVENAEPFTTTYSTNIKAQIVNRGLHIIPLHNFESPNKALLNEFSKLWHEQKIMDGSVIEIHTWLGVSTRNADKKLRRWKVIPSTS